MASSLERLVRMLSGGFSNQEQAFENPPLYAHILVKFRPLPQLAPGSLLLEQSYAINPAAPYRIRVLRAEALNGQLTIVNLHAMPLRLVHEIEAQHGAAGDLQHLEHQVEVALEPGRVSARSTQAKSCSPSSTATTCSSVSA